MVYRYLLSILLVALISLPVQADTLELLNGDRVTGEVIGLDSNEIQLKSESFGIVKISRTKVAAIYLGSRMPSNSRPTSKSRPVTRPTANSSSRATPVPIKDPLAVETVEEAIRNAGVNPNSIGNGPGVPGSNKPARSNTNTKPGSSKSSSKTKVNPPRGPANVVDQLQTNGVDPATRKQLEALFPLMSQPGVKGYFDKTVGGLSSGKVDILQVRKDAINARDEFTKMQKELGPSIGAALTPYLTILNKFIDETAPLASKPSGASTTPMKKQPPASKP